MDSDTFLDALMTLPSMYGAQIALDLLTPPQSDAQSALTANNLQILVPFASLEQFNAIANTCITDGTAKASLQSSATLDKANELAASVRALPADAIPPACALPTCSPLPRRSRRSRAIAAARR